MLSIVAPTFVCHWFSCVCVCVVLTSLKGSKSGNNAGLHFWSCFEVVFYCHKKPQIFSLRCLIRFYISVKHVNSGILNMNYKCAQNQADIRVPHSTWDSACFSLLFLKETFPDFMFRCWKIWSCWCLRSWAQPRVLQVSNSHSKPLFFLIFVMTIFSTCTESRDSHTFKWSMTTFPMELI